LAHGQDVAGHAAIRTVKRWVVLPIADLAWRLHLVGWRNALAHSRVRSVRFDPLAAAGTALIGGGIGLVAYEHVVIQQANA
jgi:hypothetical protein